MLNRKGGYCSEQKLTCRNSVPHETQCKCTHTKFIVVDNISKLKW